MRTNLKVVICILLTYFAWQDPVRLTIYEWANYFKGSSVDIYLTRFLLIYVVSHFIPFRRLFPKWYRDKKQWRIYEQNIQHDGRHNEILSDEENCTIFDPDELSSSSSLSSFLSRYEKGDWTPDDDVMRTALEWSSDDEDEEKKKVSTLDNGYITRSKSNGSFSEVNEPTSLTLPPKVHNRKRRRGHLATRNLKRRRVSFKTKKNGTKSMSDERRSAGKPEVRIVGKTKQKTAAIWQALRNGEKIEIDTNYETLPLYIRKGITEIKVDHFVPPSSLPVPALEAPRKARPSARLVEMSFKEGKLDKPDGCGFETGLTCSKVIRLGFLAMCAGLGGYVVYKVCTKK